MTGTQQVLRMVREHRTAVAFSMALALSGSALGLAQPLVVKYAIEAAGAGDVPWMAVTVLLILFVTQALVQGGGRYLLGRTGEGVVLGIRASVVGRLLRLPIPIYHRHRVGDLISRVGADTTALRRVVAEGFTDAVTGALGLVGTAAVMVWLDWRLLLVAVITMSIAFVVMLAVLPRLRTAALDGQRALGVMAADLERALGAIRTVRASRAEARETQRIVDHAKSAYSASLRVARLDAVTGPTSELAVNGTFLMVVLVGGTRVAGGQASVAGLVAFLLYLTYLTVPITAVIQAFSTMQQGAGAVGRITEVLDLPTEAATAPTLHADPPAAQASVAALEFRDVWFGYDPTRPVLRGLSFQLPHRGHVALVGCSGAGKSTIFALIERFHNVDRGQILVQGKNIQAITLNDHRSRIGLVEQNCPILHGTLRDNLTYTAPDATEEEIRRVLDSTDLTELIRSLPRGLDTEVGEHGMKLSGGQRQRIAIARTLLATPALILLDEPTAHLDPASEAVLNHTITRVARECAVLVIAHRSSTARLADRVLLLADGLITELAHLNPQPAGSTHSTSSDWPYQMYTTPTDWAPA